MCTQEKVRVDKIERVCVHKRMRVCEREREKVCVDKIERVCVHERERVRDRMYPL